MGEQAAPYGRRAVGTGTLWFSGAGLILSFCLVLANTTGVGASAVRSSQSPPSQTHTAVPASDQQRGSRSLAAANTPPPQSTTTTTTAPPPTSTTTTTTTPPPPPSTTTTTSPDPPPSLPPAPAALPARGAATAWGCTAALAYLTAYSAPGFTLDCPGNALGHEAMTCVDQPGVCAGEKLIAIADPCPEAYMNEASNSWVLTGASSAPIDPYGACP